MPSDVSPPPEWPYAAFISYSRAVDGKLAPALARGLQLFAKPWYRRRALRVFRDDDSLSANPSLWSSVQEGLDGAEFFVLLASPEAARSAWVEKEVAHWLARRPVANLLIVVTDGDIAWDDENGDFDRVRTTCLPPALYGAFSDEPRWTDLRTVREEQDLSLRVPAFRDLVADLAATLRHVPKDEILGDDLTQHRRTRRLVTAAVAVLAVVALVAVGAAVVAVNRANVAEEQRRIAEDGQRAAVARQLEAQARESVASDPRAALRLALAAHNIHPDRESEANLHRALTATAYTGTFPGQWAVGRQGFFPDGNAVVTSGDGQAVIWDIRSAPPVRLASFAAEGVPAVSPDGRTIAVVEGAATMEGAPATWSLWDVTDRAHPARIGQPRPAELTGDHPVFSPDGRVLAWVGFGSRPVQLWDITDREQPRMQHEIAADAMSLAFAPGGRILAVGNGRKDDRLPVGREGIPADMVIELWDVAAPGGPARLATRTFPAAGFATSLEFSRDGGLLVAAGDGPQADTHVATVLVDVTDVRRPVQLGQPIPGQLSPTVVAALSPTAPLLATSAGPGQAVMLWDIADRAKPRMIDTLSGHTSVVMSLAFAPDGRTLMTGGGGLYLWSLSGRTSPAVDAHAAADPVTPGSTQHRGIVATPDGKTLITGNGNGGVVVWDIEDSAQPRRLSSMSPAPTATMPGAVAVSPDGRTVAIAEQTGEPAYDEVSLWDITDRGRPRPVSRFAERDMGGVLTLVFAPDGRTLAVGGDSPRPDIFAKPGEGLLDLWNVEDSSRPAHLALVKDTGIDGAVLSASFSADGGLLVTGGGALFSTGAGSARLWNMTDRHHPRPIGPPLTGHDAQVLAVAIAPDGRTLVTGGGNLEATNAVDGTAILWDITNREQPRRIGQPLTGHQGPVAAVAFAPNGLLATAGGIEALDPRGTIRLWDVTDLPRVHPVGHGFSAHRGLVHFVAFASAGRLLVSGGFADEGQELMTAALWDMAPLMQLRADARNRACASAAGGLDEQEWARYAPGLLFRRTCPQ